MSDDCLSFNGINNHVKISSVLEEYWFCDECKFRGDIHLAIKHKENNPDHTLHHYVRVRGKEEGEWIQYVDGRETLHYWARALKPEEIKKHYKESNIDKKVS